MLFIDLALYFVVAVTGVVCGFCILGSDIDNMPHRYKQEEIPSHVNRVIYVLNRDL